MSPGFAAHAHAEYRRLLENGPVQHGAWIKDGLDIWLILGYEEAHAVSSDHRRFSTDHRLAQEALLAAGLFPVIPESSRNMLGHGEPEHGRLRSLVREAFTPRRLEALRPSIQAYVDAMLDDLAGKAGSSPIDLVETFAFPLSFTVISELLELAETDREYLESVARASLADLPDLREATRVTGKSPQLEYLAGLVQRRRSSVDPVLAADEQPDFVSALLAGQNGERLTDAEAVMMLDLLLDAGFRTTVSLVSGGMLLLLRHPEQLRLLQNRPELAPSAVEEILRYAGIAESSVLRVATEDAEIGGVMIPRGTIVSIVWAAANRDPRRFEDPDRFDIMRRPQHLAFGHGIHFCLGAPLARMEAQVALPALIERFPGLGLACREEDLRWRARVPGSVLQELVDLPVSLVP